jgi:hypothetical protein
MPETPLRPLFIPLTGKWFDAFERGDKSEEWRKHGARWNVATCALGRAVTLSRGYSGRRLRASICAASIRQPDTPERVALFGDGVDCMVIGLVDITPLEGPSRG